MESDCSVQYEAFVESFEGAPPEYSLARAMMISARSLPPSAKRLLVELNPDAPLVHEANDFAIAYRAYWAFQDLMESALVFDASIEHRHYCYYESLGYLREIGRCLLHGNYLAVLCRMSTNTFLADIKSIIHHRCKPPLILEFALQNLSGMRSRWHSNVQDLITSSACAFLKHG